jgi:hypothetical protein
MVAHKTAFREVNNKIAVMGRVLWGMIVYSYPKPAINQTYVLIVVRSAATQFSEQGHLKHLQYITSNTEKSY